MVENKAHYLELCSTFNIKTTPLTRPLLGSTKGGLDVGGVVIWGNCGTGVRVRISKPTPFIYLAFEKNGPIHILDRPKCWPIYILPFDLYTHLLLVVDKYSSQSIEYQENKQPQKSLSEKNIRIYRDVRKMGLFTYESRKFHYAIYKKLPPPRPLLPTHPSPRGGLNSRILLHVVPRII